VLLRVVSFRAFSLDRSSAEAFCGKIVPRVFSLVCCRGNFWAIEQKEMGQKNIELVPLRCVNNLKPKAHEGDLGTTKDSFQYF